MDTEYDDDECESTISNFFQVLLKYSSKYDGLFP